MALPIMIVEDFVCNFCEKQIDNKEDKIAISLIIPNCIQNNKTLKDVHEFFVHKDFYMCFHTKCFKKVAGEKYMVGSYDKK